MGLGWKLGSFCNRHRNFATPESIGLGPVDKFNEPTITKPGLRMQLAAGTAFICSYFEHGNCLWFVKGEAHPAGVEFQWDGRRIAGVLQWEGGAQRLRPSTHTTRLEAAKRFLKCYTAWCNGDWQELAEDMPELGIDPDDPDQNDCDDVLAAISRYDVKTRKHCVRT